MAHYAYLNEDNIVTSVIVGKETDSTFDGESYYGNGSKCKRTSYNTIAGVHLNNGVPFRKNYAGIGFTYDETRDAFIPPNPFPSWILNEESCIWNAPVEKPIGDYTWDENELNWKEVTNDAN